MNLELSEQEVIRRQSLEELRKLGINPYPAAKYEVNTTSKEILSKFDPEKNNFQKVCIAGRIMSRRIMGSASFVELQDDGGRIQIYFKRDNICPDEDKTLYNTVFKKLLDIGDFIGVKGPLFQTRTKEWTLLAEEFRLLSKAIRPLPEKFHGIKDPEKRYRQRYLDLIMNDDTRQIFIKRILPGILMLLIWNQDSQLK